MLVLKVTIHMSKKKSKKKVKQKPEGYKAKTQSIDERAKEAMGIKSPEENQFKMDNEKRIDMFMRFNRRKQDKLAPKVASRMHK